MVAAASQPCSGGDRMASLAHSILRAAERLEGAQLNAEQLPIVHDVCVAQVLGSEEDLAVLAGRADELMSVSAECGLDNVVASDAHGRGGGYYLLYLRFAFELTVRQVRGMSRSCAADASQIDPSNSDEGPLCLSTPVEKFLAFFIHGAGHVVVERHGAQFASYLVDIGLADGRCLWPAALLNAWATQCRSEHGHPSEYIYSWSAPSPDVSLSLLCCVAETLSTRACGEDSCKQALAPLQSLTEHMFDLLLGV